MNPELLELLPIAAVSLSALTFLVALIVLLRQNRPRDDGTATLLREELRASREEAAGQARHLREELATGQIKANELLLGTVNTLGENQKNLLERLTQAIRESQQTMREELGRIGTQMHDAQQRQQKSSDEKLELIRQTLAEQLRLLTEDQRKQAAETVNALQALTEAGRREQQAAREMLDQKFLQIQASNEKKLDEMRQTVDEKLQGTLEKRLGESFRQVSERLEAVQRGLGEMKNLADGVGDLKRVLTNVKERGTWGEYQLGAILEQILTPEQYAKNVRPKEGGEVVEFAVKLPGRQGEQGGEPVWLPIDAKFPREDYERLLLASESADAEGVRAATNALAANVRKSAKDIHDKYLAPPRTTDFAIMFLPTEGLYAEVLRQPGLHDELQARYRVLATGPTTLAAMLNSLRVGFQTLAIEQRSHEVWAVLGAVKTEFGKFGQILDKVRKQLHTATDTIDKTHVRTRAMERKLRSVEQLPAGEAVELLGLPPAGAEETDIDDNGETET